MIRYLIDLNGYVLREKGNFEEAINISEKSFENHLQNWLPTGLRRGIKQHRVYNYSSLNQNKKALLYYFRALNIANTNESIKYP